MVLGREYLAQRVVIGPGSLRVPPVVADEAKLAIVFTYFFSFFFYASAFHPLRGNSMTENYRKDLTPSSGIGARWGSYCATCCWWQRRPHSGGISSIWSGFVEGFTTSSPFSKSLQEASSASLKLSLSTS